MQKGLIKAAVLIFVFAAAVIGFSIVTNHVNEDLTTEMADATLPVITLYSNGTEINELYGYSAEMNAAYMRDSITPISSKRILPISIQTYRMAVETISYEIRSLDGSRLIANADITDFKENKGTITAELLIQNLLEAGEEYLLLIKLGSGKQTIYYYTRIVEAIDAHIDECVKFVQEFNDKTFNSETYGTLSTYMEKTTEDKETLHYVSLNSSLKQVAWGNFKGKRLTSPVPSIKEITGTYNVIVLDYVVTSVGENGESEYYNVEEYYRVRYTSNRIYLLNFERTMNQIFRGENNSFYDNFIQLGIRSEAVEFKSNEAGTMVAFVQEGELWCYNETENTLAKVFSFRGYEGIDNRENSKEHEIKIVSVDEAGSVQYIVYGYMSRGIHEGQVGMTVYHYDSLSNTNEEAVFIPSDKSFQVMKSELGQLMYVNEVGELFLMVDGSVYRINLETLETRELMKGLKDESFAVSLSNNLIAWVDEGKINESDMIHVMNLSRGEMIDIAADRGEYIKPLGFMDEDFVYGIAKAEDVFKDAAGNITFPMYQVKIVDVSKEKPEELKSYEDSGYYVSGIQIDDYTMYLNRMQYNGTAYVIADNDMISNRDGERQKIVDIKTSSSEEKERQVQISIPNKVNPKAPKLLTPKETILEETRSIALTNENSIDRYYVYAKGEVIFTTDNVAEAIIEANSTMGVVIGRDQQYIWKRSRRAVQPAFADITVGAEDEMAGSIAQCINAMLEKEGINISVSALIAGGETPKSILANTMKETRVFDLTGCSVEEVLYYVSCKSPVFVMTGSDEARLIIGYDANSVAVFDPLLKTTVRKTFAEMNELCANAGNVFFSYLKE